MVKQGLAAFDDLDYKRAIDLLERAKKETLTLEEKKAAFEGLAKSYCGANQDAQAKDNWELLLGISPEYRLPRGVSPIYQKSFQAAQEELRRKVPPVSVPSLPCLLEASLDPLRPTEGQATTVSIKLAPAKATQLALYYRTKGASAYSVVTSAVNPGTPGSAVLPGLGVRPPSVEYYLAALDVSESACCTLGDATHPQQLDVAPLVKPAPSRTWLWATLGAVAAVAVGAFAGWAIVYYTHATIKIYPQ